ncbi:MAG: Uma2 family endonuclease, partial [Chloroflexota bacterium]
VPDILFVSRERRSIVGEAYIDGAPDLLGEIISPTTDIIDRVRKRDLYARHGVRHYWLAHPEEEWLRAYELGADGHYDLVAEGHGNMAFSAPPFPSLTLQLGRLWSERPARDPR